MGAPASPRGIVWRKQLEMLEERVRQANPRYRRAGAIRAANEHLQGLKGEGLMSTAVRTRG